jgi:hypothetical protein
MANVPYINLFYRTATMVWWSKFLAKDPEIRVRFQALPEFFRRIESGTGSAQSCEYN